MHGRGLIAASLCATLARPAIADNAVETDTFINVPLVVGGTDQGGNGAVVGIRPELVVARLTSEGVRGGSGVGFGVYTELLDANLHGVIGGGLTIVPYQPEGLTVAPSLGVFHRWDAGQPAESGLTGGVFVGFRNLHLVDDHDSIDLPIGLRIDGQLGLDGAKERAVIISAQLDLKLVVGGVIAIVTVIEMLNKSR